MPEGKQVHPGLYRDARMSRQQRGRLDQPISTVAVGEADVVADREVIHAGRDGTPGELVQPARPGAQVLLAQNDPDLDRVRHGDRLGLGRRGPVRGGGGGRLQAEHQRAGETSRVSAVEHPACVCSCGEQAWDHLAGLVQHPCFGIDS